MVALRAPVQRPAIRSGVAGLRDRAQWRGSRYRVSTGLSRGERAAAAAAAGRRRILEREARALHRRDVVDHGAVQVLRRERVDEHAEALVLDDEIILGRRVLD